MNMVDFLLLIPHSLQEQMSCNSVLTGTKSAIMAIAADSNSSHIVFEAGLELHMAKEIGPSFIYDPY